MRKFLIESALFLSLVIFSFYLIFLRADGKTDPYYLRFTSPRQQSLILGTSRPAQGIQPSVLNSIITGKKIYNFSFTIDHSPYGPTYLSSIRRKLDPDTRDGIFILAVDPWSISSSSADPNDTARFKEAKMALGNTTLVNLYPNVLYLMSSYNKQFYHLLSGGKPELILHDDGWLEMKLINDSASIQKRIEKKVKTYKEYNLRQYKSSQVRLEYLKETITYLKNYGRVFMVRLPVHPRMMEIDEELIPDFNQKMLRLSEQTGTPYLDMTYMNDSILYTDGNHIYRESGKVVSARIGEWIASQNN